MLQGGGMQGRGGEKGEKRRDNYNSIINKIYFRKYKVLCKVIKIYLLLVLLSVLTGVRCGNPSRVINMLCGRFNAQCHLS